MPRGEGSGGKNYQSGLWGRAAVDLRLRKSTVARDPAWFGKPTREVALRRSKRRSTMCWKASVSKNVFNPPEGSFPL